MASIEISKDGMIFISAMIPNEETGKKNRQRKSTGLKATDENMKYVKSKLLPKFEQKLASGEIAIQAKVPTVKVMGEEYILIKRSEGHRGYTVDDYEKILINHVYPTFQDRAVDTVTIAEIESWQAKLLLKLKPKTIQDIRIPFNGLMELSFRKKLIQENPFLKAIKVTKRKDKKAQAEKAIDLKEAMKNGASAALMLHKIKQGNLKKKDPFSEAELKIMFDTAKGVIKNYIQIAFYTAMRPSEMIALTWEQINLEQKFVLCVGAITGKETEDERELNKSAKSVRIIYLPDQAVNAFKEQYKLTGEDESGYVFLSQYGKPFMSVQSIRDKMFKKVIRDSKVRERRLYDLRHSYASINLSKNRLPILFVSEQMGHADASVTLKEYSAYIADSFEDTLSMVQNAFDNFDVSLLLEEVAV